MHGGGNMWACTQDGSTPWPKLSQFLTRSNVSCLALSFLDLFIHHKNEGPIVVWHFCFLPVCMWCGLSLLTFCLFILTLLALHTYEPPALLRCGCVLVCGNCISYLVCANVWSFSHSLVSPHSVLAELRQADLITSKEREELRAISEVVRLQRVKPPEVVCKTADVLRKHGFEKEAKSLPGRQSRPSSISLCYDVQWSLLMTATLWHPLLSTDWRCP